MLFEDKKSVLSRALAGGIIGLVVFIPLGGLFNDLVNGGLITMGPHTPFRLVSYDLEALVGSASLALAIQIALYFLMGAVVGIATLPFTDSGRELVLHSLVHFAVTAGLLILTCTLLGWACENCSDKGPRSKPRKRASRPGYGHPDSDVSPASGPARCNPRPLRTKVCRSPG